MSQAAVTLDEIITAVRELTFDRFIIPAFAIKAKAGYSVSITPPKVGVTPSNLSYADFLVYNVKKAIPAFFPSIVGGSDVVYSVSPALPKGINLDPEDGSISGIPTVAGLGVNYTITATNKKGFTTCTINLIVIDSTLPLGNSPCNLGYDSYLKLEVGEDISSIMPSVTGNVTSYSVSPALPAGLSLDSATGIITGIPTEISGTTNYVIRATNDFGHTSFSIRILVFDPKGSAEELPTDGTLIIKQGTVPEGETAKDIVFKFSDYPMLEDLMNALIAEDIIVAYTPYFKGTEPSNSLVRVSNRSLDTDFTSFRRYFFSDTEIKEKIVWYYWKVLDIPNATLSTEFISKLQRPSEQHIAIWVAYSLVEKRRLYENAALSIGQSFTDGSDYVGSNMSNAPLSTTIQIGSVFSITENASEGYFQEDFNRVGSDNVWGDRFSFWYKLMLYLRQLLEETFGDYSLRKDTVMQGKVELTRELDFRSYYDSYPFTLSPLSRGILSKTP